MDQTQKLKEMLTVAMLIRKGRAEEILGSSSQRYNRDLAECYGEQLFYCFLLRAFPVIYFLLQLGFRVYKGPEKHQLDEIDMYVQRRQRCSGNQLSK